MECILRAGFKCVEAVSNCEYWYDLWHSSFMMTLFSSPSYTTMLRNRGNLFTTDICVLWDTQVYLPVPFSLICLFKDYFSDTFTDYTFSSESKTVLQCKLHVLLNFSAACLHYMMKYSIHSQFPLECPISTPLMQNVHIPPLLPCWTHKACVECGPSWKGCAGRKQGLTLWGL